METIVLNTPLDMHLHLRDGEMLKLTAPLSADSFAGAVIMPNLVPPVDSLESLLAYRGRIKKAVGEAAFTPLMTLFFRNYTESELVEARPNLFGIKLYPAGATTNSEGGVKAMADAESTMKMMEEQGIPLLVHGESHGFVMDREQEFLSVYRDLATRFPQLKITMEHITTAAAVRLLDEFPNLYATVTLQHLLITLDHVIGGLMDPHLFCKPIAKRPEDREALLQAALSGHPKLMFGSDSAPHPKHRKECCGCAAGVFTAPLALPCLAQLFERHGSLDRLEAFTGGNARRIYELGLPERKVALGKGEFKIPAAYRSYGEEVVPMYAGEILNWTIL